MRIIIFIAITLISFMIGHSTAGTWTGYCYKDINNMEDESTWLVQPGFSTLEDCRGWALGNFMSCQAEGTDYECGYKCQYDRWLDINVCKKTEQ